MNAQLVLIDTLADATAWRRKNQHAYDAFVSWAKQDMAEGVRPSIARYFEVARVPWMARRLGLVRESPQLLLNNSLRADLARLIMREHRDIVFCIRQSKADMWIGDTQTRFSRDGTTDATTYPNKGVESLRTIDPTSGVFR